MGASPLLAALALRAPAAARRKLPVDLPAASDDSWHYADWKGLRQGEWAVPPSAAPVLRLPAEVPGALRIVFVDGVHRPELGDRTLPKGLRIVPGEVEKLPFENDPFEEHAFATSGLHLDLEAGVRLEAPVVVDHVFSTVQGNARQGRLFLRLGRSSSAQVLERFVLPPEESFDHFVSEFDLEENARLHWRQVDAGSDLGHRFSSLRVRLHRDSFLSALNATAGSAFSRFDQKIRLVGENAEADLSGLYLLHGRRHADHRLKIEHMVPRTRSRQLFKGILDGESRGVFTGAVFVAEGATGTDSEQLNQNLLLSRQARVDTRPQLEILHDDVKCGHGATVGQLDPVHLFYLRSRGIPEKDAHRILCAGFVRDLLARVEEKGLRDAMTAELASASALLADGPA